MVEMKYIWDVGVASDLKKTTESNHRDLIQAKRYHPWPDESVKANC
jgi:hypothetical protein